MKDWTTTKKILQETQEMAAVEAQTSVPRGASDDSSAVLKQRNTWDCSICCMAMATGRSYEDVLEVYLSSPDDARRWELGIGTSTTSVLRVLTLLGWKPVMTHGVALSYVGIVSVASINFPGKLHHVYWDGQKVMDPSTLQTHDEKSMLLGACDFITNYSTEFQGVLDWEQQEYRKYSEEAEIMYG